jgi:hypothetical protein
MAGIWLASVVAVAAAAYGFKWLMLAGGLG